MPSAGWKVRVASTGSNPEAVETVPIVRAAEPGKPRTVVMSLGAASRTDLPMPELQAGDVIQVFAELEVTTDAPVATHPGLIGRPYTYAPELEAKLLLAADQAANEPQKGKALALGDLWRGRCTHQKHHQVILVSGEYEVPAGGLPWKGPSWVNLTLAASHRTAGQGQVILVGENEKEPRVDQDVSGIRVVRFRPRASGGVATKRHAGTVVSGIPVAKRETVVMSRELKDLREGEQLLVRAHLLTDSRGLKYPTRVSTRMFLANRPEETSPQGAVQEVGSWKGHLAKESGLNRLPEEGEAVSEKVGVMRILQNAPGPLFVNVAAVSAAPFNNPTVNKDVLPVGKRSYLEITRFSRELAG